MKMCNLCNTRVTVGIVAVIDMAFGAVLFSLYLRKLMFFYSSSDSGEEEYSPPSLRLFILLPLTLNVFQVLIGYHLLMSTRQDDLFRSLAKATMWFQTAAVILTFLSFKLLLVLLFSSTSTTTTQGKDTFPTTLLVWETLFKLFSIYIVKNFIDDLKSLVYPPPSVHFYNVYIPPSSPTPTPTPTVTPTSMDVLITSRPSSPSPQANNDTGALNSNQNALNFPNYMSRPVSGSISPTPVFV